MILPNNININDRFIVDNEYLFLEKWKSYDVWSHKEDTQKQIFEFIINNLSDYQIRTLQFNFPRDRYQSTCNSCGQSTSLWTNAYITYAQKLDLKERQLKRK
jgi:hypothetical protein